MVHMRSGLLLLAVLAVITPSRSHAQTWRTALTAAAEASLYIDFCQVHYGLAHGSPTWVLGQRLTPRSLAVVNGAEALVNVAAPRKYRPWLNGLTLAFHVVAIYRTARRPIGLLETRAGEDVARIGVRLWW